MEIEKEIAKVIYNSSLWNSGRDSHNALSELTISLKSLFTDYVLKIIEEHNVYFLTNLEHTLLIKKEEIKNRINEVSAHVERGDK